MTYTHHEHTLNRNEWVEAIPTQHIGYCVKTHICLSSEKHFSALQTKSNSKYEFYVATLEPCCECQITCLCNFLCFLLRLVSLHTASFFSPCHHHLFLSLTCLHLSVLNYIIQPHRTNFQLISLLSLVLRESYGIDIFSPNHQTACSLFGEFDLPHRNIKIRFAKSTWKKWIDGSSKSEKRKPNWQSR